MSEKQEIKIVNQSAGGISINNQIINHVSSVHELEELEDCSSIIFKDFSTLLNNYSIASEPNTRRDIFNLIAGNSWDFVVNQPGLEVDKFFLDKKNIDLDVDILIKLLKKIKSGKKLLSEDIIDFFIFLDKQGFFLSESGFEGWTKLVRRIIIFLAYDQPDLLYVDLIKERIVGLASKEDLQWIEFWVDIYLRFSIGKIEIKDKEILGILTSVCNRYKDENSRKPISVLWKIVTSPLEAVVEYKDINLFNLIKKCARISKSFFDCKWCVVAFQRIIPLLDDSEDQLRNYNNLGALLSEFDKSLKLKSPQLQSIYLDSLLRNFIYTKELISIIEYEKSFRANNVFHKIPFSLRSRLQLEYACCLYIISCELPLARFFEIAFGKLLENNSNPLKDNLLKNDKLEFQEKYIYNPNSLSFTQQTNEKKLLASIKFFLEKYIMKSYEFTAKELLENSHIAARDFPALTRFVKLHSDIEAQIISSLRKNISPQVENRPVFYAKSAFALSRIHRSKNLDVIKVYVTLALQADEYSVMRNARDLAHSLYACYYYGAVNEREEIEILADKLAKITIFTNSNELKLNPKLHWAYYSGIKWKYSPIDCDFINKLYEVKLPRKANQLKYREDESFRISESAKFTYEMKSIIDCYQKKKSILALSLAKNLNIPDVWNIVGTIIFDNKTTDSESLNLRQAAHFYKLAKCFADENSKYQDQKYWFNYIRCRGLSINLDGFSPVDDEFYIVDTSRYLRQPSSLIFRYKEDCVKPYLELLEKLLDKGWSDLKLDTKIEIDKLLGYDWIQKEIRKKSFLNLKSLIEKKKKDEMRSDI
jgi:hypothetical protein